MAFLYWRVMLCRWNTANIVNMSEDSNLVKKLLSDYLGFLKYKVDHDKMTLEEEQAFVRLIEKNIPLLGTSEDFAKYYKQSPVNIRSVISRKLMEKPIRRVFYPFISFAKKIPKKWNSLHRSD